MSLCSTSEIPGGFLVPNDTHLGKWQKEVGKLDHDNFLPPLVVSHLKPGDCVIDCGAFNGDHTIAYSRAVGEHGIIFAIEPGALAFKCLKHNISLFPIKNVIPIHSVVADNSEYFVQHNENENLGASTCSETERANSEGIYSISIDGLAAGLDRKVNFIKMDIEGWELRALRGAEETITRHRPKLLIEINIVALEKNGATPDMITNFLESHDYLWEIVQPECTFFDNQFDILCLPI